ncbi:unnamed protein product [Sphenostylis stenocarpa]|uniref:Uncharacterized protein n=1 Tax=Sphenostylis stenocarpa TaxID=92480 RepID=A0AA86SZK5_9FABA|nr:unnamed protein product [Sphenostylis stenocarpa]
MTSVQDEKVPATLKETETTKKEATTKIEETIPEKSGINGAGVTVTVDTKEVVIEKTEEKAREVIIEDPTAKENTETAEKKSAPTAPAEDEKANDESEATEAAEEAITVEKTEA